MNRSKVRSVLDRVAADHRRLARLPRIGFWRPHPDSEAFWQRIATSDPNPESRQNAKRELALPWPGDHVDRDWAKSPEGRAVATYAANPRFRGTQYRGTSRCRLCGKMNGSADMTDGAVVWPEGFAHYIKDHGVRPPQAFVDHVLSRAGSVGAAIATGASGKKRFVVSLAGCFGGRTVLETDDALVAVREAKRLAAPRMTVRGVIHDRQLNRCWEFDRYEHGSMNTGKLNVRSWPTGNYEAGVNVAGGTGLRAPHDVAKEADLGAFLRKQKNCVGYALMEAWVHGGDRVYEIRWRPMTPIPPLPSEVLMSDGTSYPIMIRFTYPAVPHASLPDIKAER